MRIYPQGTFVLTPLQAGHLKNDSGTISSTWLSVPGRDVMRDGAKVTIYDGHGRLHADHKVSVTGGESGDVELTGGAVIIASGSLPRTIPGFEVDGEVVLTSDEVLSLHEIPSSVAVIGGGAIGCEFASVFADLGSQVTILEALPKILPGCDTDTANVVVRAFKKRGIEIKTGVKVAGHAATVLDAARDL